jgi:PPOX class probable F420-dependent enzyme
VSLPAPATLDAHVRTFLEPAHFVTLATTNADGSAHQAVIWYRLDPDDRILVNSRVGRRWPTNLLRDPRCSIAVMDEVDGNNWVGLTGVVETVIDDVEQARDDIVALAVRYDDAGDDQVATFRSQARISFRIRVVRIHDHLGG